MHILFSSVRHRVVLFSVLFFGLNVASIAYGNTLNLTGECRSVYNDFQEKGQYKSFGFNSETGQCSSSWNFKNQGEADSRVLSDCKGCRILENSTSILIEKNIRLNHEYSGFWAKGNCKTSKLAIGVSHDLAVRYIGGQIPRVAILPAGRFRGDLYVGRPHSRKPVDFYSMNRCTSMPLALYSSFGEFISFMEKYPSIASTCAQQQGGKCAEEIFKFADVSDDQRLSVAELSRVLRVAAVFASYEATVQRKQSSRENDGFVSISQLTATSMFVALSGPILTRNLVGSYDFDGDGFLSLSEIVQDRQPLMQHSPKNAAGSIAAMTIVQTFMSVGINAIFNGMSGSLGSLTGSIFR